MGVLAVVFIVLSCGQFFPGEQFPWPLAIVLFLYGGVYDFMRIKNKL